MRNQLDKFSGDIGLLSLQVGGLAELLTGRAAEDLGKVVTLLDRAGVIVDELYRIAGPTDVLGRRRRATPQPVTVKASAATPTAPPALTPTAPTRKRRHEMDAFLEAFARTGSIGMAAIESGCPAHRHYYLRYADAVYFAAFEAIQAPIEARRRAAREQRAAEKLERSERRRHQLASGAVARQRLLDAFEECGSIYRAAGQVGIGHQKHRKWLLAFPDYRAEFERIRMWHQLRGTLSKRGRPIKVSAVGAAA